MRKWLGGIISAVSGGFVTAMATIVIDPAKFNFQQGLTNLFIVMGFSGGFALFTFLQKSPLPNGEAK